MRRDELAVAPLVVVRTPAGWAAFSPAELAEAVERAKSIVPAQPAANPAQAAPERLVDAEELGRLTSIPVSWWAEAARRGDVPCRWFGRYPRFAPSEIYGCKRFTERS